MKGKPRAPALDSKFPSETDGERPGLVDSAIVKDLTAGQQAEAALLEADERLESRVRERTAELERTNALLLEEIERHRRAESERERVVEISLRAAEHAERHRAKLQAVFQAMSAGVLVFDMNGNAILVNEAEATICGFPSADDLKRDLAFFASVYELASLDGEPVPVGQWPASKVLRGESVVNWELRCRRRDTGQQWFFSFSCEPVRDAQGKQILAVVITHDITAPKRAEQELCRHRDHLDSLVQERTLELQESTRTLQHVQEIGRIGSYVYEFAAGRWTSSAILDGIFGIGAEFQRSEAGWLEIVDPAQRAEMLACLRDSIEMGRRFDKEYRIVRVDDGAHCWVHGIGEVEYDAAGTPARLVGTLQDITARKRTEEKIYRYARRLIEMEEDLRKRIAMELHDDIGQVLTALGLNLALIGNHLKEEAGDNLGSRLEDSRWLVKEISRTVRNLMTELRPSQLDEYGVAAAIRSHAEQYAQRTGIVVRVRVDPGLPRLAPKKETALFRIAQEALNNIAKHAGATEVSVCLNSDCGLVRLAIADDGAGFVPQAASPLPASSGWGLTIMRERAELAGGVFRLDSVPGAGTTICVEIRGEE